MYTVFKGQIKLVNILYMYGICVAGTRFRWLNGKPKRKPAFSISPILDKDASRNHDILVQVYFKHKEGGVP